MLKTHKRQDLPSGLWVVATPIGNLMDFSPRALQAIEDANAVLCEDTRVSEKLIRAFELPMKELIRFDENVIDQKIETILSRLKSGESLVLLSDAGTPAINDPGARLVFRALEEGIRVSPFPGPSAVSALLSVGGFRGSRFAFHGFFPRKTGDREAALEHLVGVDVFFESPKRIVESLQFLANRYPSARLVVAKELTKLFESLFAGPILKVLQSVTKEVEAQGERGEWVFGMETEVSKKSEDESFWEQTLSLLIDCGISVKQASQKVSQEFGVNKNLVYAKALEIQKQN